MNAEMLDGFPNTYEDTAVVKNLRFKRVPKILVNHNPSF